MQLSARNVVLELLSASPIEDFPVSALLRASQILTISPNNLRVTLSRLKREGLVESARRGTYRLSPSAQRVGQHVRAWQEMPRRVRPWQGGWAMAFPQRDHEGTAGPLDRRQLARCLRWLGFRAYGDVWVRPDNLRGGIPKLREDLDRLGAEPHVFEARELDRSLAEAAAQLWDTKALMRAYRRGCGLLERSAARLPTLTTEQAAKETFLRGREILHVLALDPLLPDPLVDTAMREALFASMIDYNRRGLAIWQEVLAAFAAESDEGFARSIPTSNGAFA